MKKPSFPTSWNLSVFYNSDTDPKIAGDKKILEQKTNEFVQKWQTRTDYLEKSEILKVALDDYEKWAKDYGVSGNPYFYFALRNIQDQLNPKISSNLNKTTEMYLKNKNAIQFFEINLSKITPENQTKFLSSPLLIDYKHFLENTFKWTSYLLSNTEEKIINLKSMPAYEDWIKMTEKFLSKEEAEILDEKGKKKTVSFTEIQTLAVNKNKKIRDVAAKKFNEILAKYTDMAESEINAILQNKKIDDELRKLPRPDISRHLVDDMDTQTIDTLVKTVTANFSLAQRYYHLKAKLLKLPKLAYHERNVEYGNLDKNYTLDQMIEKVKIVFGNLDSEFLEIFNRFLENGQIDFLPHKGKKSGAACFGNLISQPTFIYQNFNGKLDDVNTLAHEMGHAINDELIKKSQNALNFGTPTSTAEVASTFMEDFVLAEILKTADEKTRLALMVSKLNDDINTIFRQIALYNFETELHKNFRETGFLSVEDIGKLFQKHMFSYMGPAVEKSPGSQNWWVYWSHIRMYFYVYSYAGGLLISKYLQRMIRENPLAIREIKTFLSTGLSESPKDIFKRLSIDISDQKFWEQGLKEIEDLLNETESLAKKLKKI